MYQVALFLVTVGFLWSTVVGPVDCGDDWTGGVWLMSQSVTVVYPNPADCFIHNPYTDLVLPIYGWDRPQLKCQLRQIRLCWQDCNNYILVIRKRACSMLLLLYMLYLYFRNICCCKRPSEVEYLRVGIPGEEVWLLPSFIWGWCSCVYCTARVLWCVHVRMLYPKSERLLDPEKSECF